jgi:peptidoglycan hydrolase-like protein with peptidoglycan-binding domain
MQTLLNDTGFYSGAIDGKMGGITKSALQKWQIKNELVSTGIVNFVTQATLNTILSTQFKK